MTFRSTSMVGFCARRSASGVGNDPYLSNVVAMLHFDGVADTSQTITDSSPRANTFTAFPASGAQVDTAEKKFGSGSCLFGPVDPHYLRGTATTDWQLTGAFTLEFWVYLNAYGTSGVMFASQMNGGAAGGFEFFASTNGTIQWNRSNVVTEFASTTGQMTTGGWTFLSVCWNESTYFLHKDGTLLKSQTSSTAPALVTGDLRIGNYISNSNYNMNGWIDEFRLTKGVCRYSASNYTAPTSTFPDI